MKNIFILLVFCLMGNLALAQQDNPQQPNDDQLQQQPPTEVQKATEKAAAKEARKKMHESKQKKREAKQRKEAFVERREVTADTIKPKPVPEMSKPE